MAPQGLATDHNGLTLQEYIRIPQNHLDYGQYTPLSVALAVVKCAGKFLLVFNRSRCCWEVPGGHIESGESPLAAVQRELLEETGQRVAELKFEGILKFHFSKGQDPEETYGILYSATLNTLAPFTATQEISEITLWDKLQDIGYVNEIDSALIQIVENPLKPG